MANSKMLSDSMVHSLFLALVFIITMTLSRGDAALLDEKCERDSDCKAALSQCDAVRRKCTCQPYTVEFNSTTCLKGTLLGFECLTDSQCAVKVPTSGCVNGVCACGTGYVAYRRHTCLSPTKLGEVCFDNDQCSLADRSSYCKFVVPKVFGRCQCQSGKEVNGPNKKCAFINTKIGQPCQDDGDCPIANAYCQRKLDGNSFCTCDIAFSPSNDRKRCLPTYRGLLSSTSLGYPCYANLQCQLADPNSICNSDGICDCSAANSTMCNSRVTGCHKNTFQCHSDGKCISWYHVCDSVNHCEDGSDEMCDMMAECPRQAFQCGTGILNHTRNTLPATNAEKSTATVVGNALEAGNLEYMKPVKCISRAKICDGNKDCPDGSDELGCVGREKCPPGTFQCSTTKECLPEYRYCNSIADCKDSSDENDQKCQVEFQPSDFCPFRCSNGLCRSSAILCSGIDGCGDNSDETRCQVCRCPRAS